MRIAILGAHGKIWFRLGKILTKTGDDAVGFIRNPEQSCELNEAGIRPIIADLISTSIEKYAGMLKGFDAVVFCSGAGGSGTEMTDAIDGQGVVKIVAAAKLANIQRFILVSAFTDAFRDEKMLADFEHYMKVKRQADVDLVGSSLSR